VGHTWNNVACEQAHVGAQARAASSPDFFPPDRFALRCSRSWLKGEPARRLETMRRHTRLSVLYKMCHGFLDRKWEDYLIPNKEGRTRGSHDFKFIVPKVHKNVFRFSLFQRTMAEWNKLPKETVPVNLSLFLKVNFVRLFLIAVFISFICSFSFYYHFNVSELARCPLDVADVIIFRFRFRTYGKAIRFASPCNINNFDAVENGGA